MQSKRLTVKELINLMHHFAFYLKLTFPFHSQFDIHNREDRNQTKIGLRIQYDFLAENYNNYSGFSSNQT